MLYKLPLYWANQPFGKAIGGNDHLYTCRWIATEFVTMPHLGRNARVRASHEHLCPSVCGGVMIWSSTRMTVHLCNSGKLMGQRNQCEKVQCEILCKRRRYLFTESLSNLISCAHTHSALELILWHSYILDHQITESQWPGQDPLSLTERNRDAAAMPSLQALD